MKARATRKFKDILTGEMRRTGDVLDVEPTRYLCSNSGKWGTLMELVPGGATKAELALLAEGYGIEVPSRATKADIEALVMEAEGR